MTDPIAEMSSRLTLGWTLAKEVGQQSKGNIDER